MLIKKEVLVPQQIKMYTYPLDSERPFVWCMEREPQETQTETLNEKAQNLKGVSLRVENNRKLNACTRSQINKGESHECSVFQSWINVAVASNDTKRTVTGKHSRHLHRIYFLFF